METYDADTLQRWTCRDLQVLAQRLHITRKKQKKQVLVDAILHALAQERPITDPSDPVPEHQQEVLHKDRDIDVAEHPRHQDDRVHEPALDQENPDNDPCEDLDRGDREEEREQEREQDGEEPHEGLSQEEAKEALRDNVEEHQGDLVREEDVRVPDCPGRDEGVQGQVIAWAEEGLFDQDQQDTLEQTPVALREQELGQATHFEHHVEHAPEQDLDLHADQTALEQAAHLEQHVDQAALEQATQCEQHVEQSTHFEQHVEQAAHFEQHVEQAAHFEQCADPAAPEQELEQHADQAAVEQSTHCDQYVEQSTHCEQYVEQSTLCEQHVEQAEVPEQHVERALEQATHFERHVERALEQATHFEQHAEQALELSTHCEHHTEQVQVPEQHVEQVPIAEQHAQPVEQVPQVHQHQLQHVEHTAGQEAQAVEQVPRMHVAGQKQSQVRLHATAPCPQERTLLAQAPCNKECADAAETTRTCAQVPLRIDADVFGRPVYVYQHPFKRPFAVKRPL